MFKNSVGWLSITNLLVQGSNFLKIFLITLVLGPDSIAYFVISASLFAAISIVSDFGIKTLYISGEYQKIEDEFGSDKLIESLWAINIGFKSIVVLFSIIVGWLSSIYWDNIEIFNYTMLLSLSSFILGFTNPNVCDSEKKTLFKNIFYIEGFSCLSSLIFTVYLLYLNFGVLGLVYSYLFSSIVSVIISFYIYGFNRPRLASHEIWKITISKGKSVLTISLATYVTYSLDKLIIASLISPTIASLYYLAQKISEIPTQFVTMVVSRALFPIYKRLYDECGFYKLKNFIVNKVKITMIIFSIIFAIFLSVRFVAIPTQWQGVIDILPWIFLGSAFRVLGHLVSPALVVIKHLKQDAKYKLQEATFYVFSLPLCAYFFNINGVIFLFLVIYIFAFIRRVRFLNNAT